MAVQAHYHSKATNVNSELRIKRSKSSTVWLEDLQLEQQLISEQNYNHGLIKGGFGRHDHQVGRVLNVNTVYSDPESELTCYLSVPAPRKRNRSSEEINFANSQQQQEQIMQPQQQQINGLFNMPKIQDQKIENRTSTGILKLTNCDEIRIHQSGGTSTSARTTPIINDTDLMAFIRQQNDEIDEFIRHQNERLRLGLEEKRKRHCRSILSSLDQQIARKLKEKDVELESIRNRNSELEEKVKQVIIENQMWQNAARNNEAVVSTLRSSLEQVLLQNIGLTKEGFGDSEDDAQSRCNSEGILDDVQARKMNENEELRHQKLCKVCRQNEISVLLLPCRHLCVCKDCESKQESCPVCNSNKNASLQIYVL